MTTQKVFVDSVDQDQDYKEHAVWSLIYTVHIFILDYNSTVTSSSNGSLFLANQKVWIIYSVVKELTVDLILKSTTVETNFQIKHNSGFIRK